VRARTGGNARPGARADTGITVTELSDVQEAIGYATADGTPQVAIINVNSGNATKADVDWSTFVMWSRSGSRT